ncbi:MAG: hypothetical protein V1645_02425 [archaeon]
MDYNAYLERTDKGEIAVVFAYGKNFISGWRKPMITRVNFSDDRELSDLMCDFNLRMQEFSFSNVNNDGKTARIDYLCDGKDKDDVLKVFVKYFVAMSRDNRSGLYVEC